MDVSKRTFLHASTPTFPQNSIGRRTEQEVVCLSVGAMFGTLCSRILCAVPISAALGAPGSHQGSRETVQSLQTRSRISRVPSLSLASRIRWTHLSRRIGVVWAPGVELLTAGCGLHFAPFARDCTAQSGAERSSCAVRLGWSQRKVQATTRRERGVEHWKVSIGWM